MISVLLLTAVVAVAAKEFDCAVYPPSILMKKIVGDKSVCSCWCDVHDIGTECVSFFISIHTCILLFTNLFSYFFLYSFAYYAITAPQWKCPEGYSKVANGKSPTCQKSTSSNKWVPKAVELECPEYMDGPVFEDGVAHCIDKKSECTDTDESSRGSHTIYGAKVCNCERKHPITCKDLGDKPAVLKMSSGVVVCEYLVPMKIVATETTDMLPNYPGFDTSTGFKDIDCPKTIPLKPSDVMCGPDTSEYINMMMEKFDEIYEKNITPPKRVECHTNCASVSCQKM